MGDMGDIWRDVKEHKQRRRQFWNSCPQCAARFGTGTLVAPGRKCRHDDWVSPGNVGDDEKQAKQIELEAAKHTQQKIKEKRKLKEQRRKERLPRTCSECQIVLKDIARKDRHMRKVHGIVNSPPSSTEGKADA